MSELSLCFTVGLVAPHERGLTLCENKDAKLRCPWGTEIEITHANYGRTDAYTCPHRSIYDINCTDPTHTGRLQDECNGRRTCGVWARDRFWGDTCKGTHKYLDVDYRCGTFCSAGVLCYFWLNVICLKPLHENAICGDMQIGGFSQGNMMREFQYIAHRISTFAYARMDCNA